MFAYGLVCYVSCWADDKIGVGHELNSDRWVDENIGTCCKSKSTRLGL